MYNDDYYRNKKIDLPKGLNDEGMYHQHYQEPTFASSEGYQAPMSYDGAYVCMELVPTPVN